MTQQKKFIGILSTHDKTPEQVYQKIQELGGAGSDGHRSDGSTT